MIVDAHVYLGPCLFGYGQSLEEIRANMDRLGIEKAILVPVKPRNYHLAPMNELVAEAVQKYPDQFLGLCRVDPWQAEAAVAEVQRGFEELGACGLYLDPWEENFQANDEVVFPVLQELSRCDKPVVLNAGHLRVSHPTQIRDIASRFPAVRFVACNGAQINISGMLQFEARRMLEACPNVVIQTAGTYREDFLEEITTEVGEERVLFASRSPVYDQEFEMARVRFAHLSASQKQKLWGSNALGVFGTRSSPVLPSWSRYLV
ncbi:MAG: amidohydrolase family protein [Chloroflexi bacterium]|nr:amidohydrolase family protein [Chloroflexota bacterium]